MKKPILLVHERCIDITVTQAVFYANQSRLQNLFSMELEALSPKYASRAIFMAHFNEDRFEIGGTLDIAECNSKLAWYVGKCKIFDVYDLPDRERFTLYVGSVVDGSKYDIQW